MKDMMIDMMVSMMPFMQPFMWAGVVIAIIGFMLILLSILLRSNVSKVITWSGRIVFGVAVFFIAAQVAGYFLNMPPTINFGDSSKFEFILVSFWQIGLGLLVAALVIKFAGSSKKLSSF